MVLEALDKEKYEIKMFDPRDDLPALVDAKGAIDIAMILLHGRFGEDGRIQALLDILGIPFVGSGVLSSAMAFNKKVAKVMYRAAGLKVPMDMVLRRNERISPEEIAKALGSRTVVKPVAEGSSLGVSVCRDREGLLAGIEDAFEYDSEILVEEYVEGQEITCCVLGNQFLETFPLVEIVPGERHRFFDYEAKYMPGASQEICPARLSPALAERARADAKAAHEALKCRVWSRTDMIIRSEEIYLLETNTIPGMTENSLFPRAARTAGLSLSDLLDRLIDLSMEDCRCDGKKSGDGG